jgi:hypothetical protein
MTWIGGGEELLVFLPYKLKGRQSGSPLASNPGALVYPEGVAFLVQEAANEREVARDNLRKRKIS